MTGPALIRLTVNGRDFAAHAHEVRHVARGDQLRPDDDADGGVGTVRLGGQQVPVFSLNRVLGLPPADAPRPAGDQHIAVTGLPHRLVGWLVDRVARESATGDLQIAPLPPTVGGRACKWFGGIITGGAGTPILLLNPDQLSPIDSSETPVDAEQPAFEIATSAAEAPVSPTALVFSTPALPPAPVQRFALSGTQVAAIVKPSAPICVPGCADHVAGLTLWREAAVPVLDFRRAAGGQAAGQRRLIARCGAPAQSLLIAFAIEPDVIMHRPAADDRIMPDVPCPPFANGVFNINGDAVALIDLDALLAGAA